MSNRRQFIQNTTAGLMAIPVSNRLLASPCIPKVSDEFRITTRYRVEKKNRILTRFKTENWMASETAIIICDMWQEHPCKLAQYRADRMAPRMNQVVSWARDHGVAIIHAPSGGMQHYDNTPYRQRIKTAVMHKPPVPIQSWCYHNSDHEGKWPIVDDVRLTEGAVTGCDDPQPRAHKDHDRHQNSHIKIIGYDGVSDNGQEIFNFLEQEGRNNIVLMGVHTNMCVLGRPFGIRQQHYLGKNVVLCRDLTDALYDPRDPPHVSHARGLELVIEHIEQYWCPTILGGDLKEAVKS
ncbi:MAG: protein-signal peptide and transmembrane prediction [Planctomycetaceae bacterium]|nr:protein-signal peptide and transmembrane prediction [Planctomycetaceae bacterium]